MTPPGDAALRARIEALLTAYVHCIDDDRLEDWPELFAEDGRYRILTRENREAGLPLAVMYCEGRGMLRDRVTALRTANIYEPHTYCHLTGAAEIAAGQRGESLVRSNFAVIRTMASGDMTVFACGRYEDRIVDTDGALRFAERTVVCDSRRIDTLLVLPL